ncbi:hypothetical protein D3C81_880700 [compost metagenome]
MMARMCSTGIGATFSCMRSSAVTYSCGIMSGRVDSTWPSLTKVVPSASRSVTNWVGLPVGGCRPRRGSSPSSEMPENTPEFR